MFSTRVVTGYYFWRTLLSPLLRVILLQGSKLTLGLSRWHYPDSCSYFHSFPGIPSEPGNALHTTMQRRGFPCPSTALFFRPAPFFYLHQLPATSTFKLRFSDDHTPFKIQFYHKNHVVQILQPGPLCTYFVSHTLSLMAEDNTLS